MFGISLVISAHHQPHLNNGYDIPAINADVRCQGKLSGCQLLVEARRRRLLGQPLDVDGGVLSLDVNQGDRAVDSEKDAGGE